MRIRYVFMSGISVFCLLAALPAFAYQSGSQRGGQSAPVGQPAGGMMQRDQLRTQDRTTLKDRSQIYGSQLMTPAERRAYRDQMRNLKTAQEREALRKQHHEQMQKRAAERGMRLPDMPPGQGAGMGPGGGMGRGAGMGPGGGMGPGMGPGAGMRQGTQQQTMQQQQNQGTEKQVQQKQSTEQQTQQQKDDGNR
ncbi:hypothetical protein EAH75_02195 [Rhodanobacter glycinis]|uniref:Uncharacterized protein n=2 Tax=Rhodanobacter glycinis TaxID=582702 RepID=A0A502BX40_9GAMM|nr:hypothetical protein EAH88_16415 [Rhodanobacter glycinis]TPG50316.1 hypothetical protein EAH75_02195 [Rhodanobacter glycinis]